MREEGREQRAGQRTFETAQPPTVGTVFPAALRIYLGVLGQIGDVIMYSAVARRVRELYPDACITLAVSARYREAGELLVGLPYIDRLFVTRLYFEKLGPALFQPWERGWRVDLRGEDEVWEESVHDIVLPTRPQHRREPWWMFAHAVDELAHMCGVPMAGELHTEIAIPGEVSDGETFGQDDRISQDLRDCHREGSSPASTVVPPVSHRLSFAEACGRRSLWKGGENGMYVIHNDPATDPRKAWPWENVCELVAALGPGRCILLGGPGVPAPGCVDLRGKTTLAQAASTIQRCRCFIGIDSGLMWIAGSLQAPTVGLYGSDYIGRPAAVQPVNPRAAYLSVERMAEIGVEEVVRAVARGSGRREEGRGKTGEWVRGDTLDRMNRILQDAQDCFG